MRFSHFMNSLKSDCIAQKPLIVWQSDCISAAHLSNMSNVNLSVERHLGLCRGPMAPCWLCFDPVLHNQWDAESWRVPSVKLIFSFSLYESTVNFRETYSPPYLYTFFRFFILSKFNLKCFMSKQTLYCKFSLKNKVVNLYKQHIYKHK